MTAYVGLIDTIGLRSWCDAAGATEAPMTMAQLLAKSKGANAASADLSLWDLPFPSLDELHKACGAIPRTRDLTAGVERVFLDAKDSMKVVLDPLTQPLSWILQTVLELARSTPWWLMISLICLFVLWTTRSARVVGLVLASLLALAFVDHYTYAIQTLSIIMTCALLSVMLGVPIGITMSMRDGFRRLIVPLLDTLQTLPTFVYLIPLIFLFSVTEPKLYGIAIIVYSIAPVIRMTDLGIRLVDRDVLEAADAFGMSGRQKLFSIQIPLALPNIMAGVNQTIMLSLSMVVIASLVSAPGLGTLVLRGINNLELGVGLVAGLGIVILAIMLDRVSKAALQRINLAHKP